MNLFIIYAPKLGIRYPTIVAVRNTKEKWKEFYNPFLKEWVILTPKKVILIEEITRDITIPLTIQNIIKDHVKNNC